MSSSAASHTQATSPATDALDPSALIGKQLLATAGNIVEIAKKVRRNKVAVRALAESALALAEQVEHQTSSESGFPVSESFFERLTAAFAEVEELVANAVTKRNIYWNTITLPKRTNELAQILLAEARIFEFLVRQVADSDAGSYVDERPFYDGQLRILRHSDVEAELDIITEQERGNNTVVYASARMEGKLMIVKYTTTPYEATPTTRTDTSDGYDSQFLQNSSPHPNVAQLYGSAMNGAPNNFTAINSGVNLAVDVLCNMKDVTVDLIARWHSIRLLTLAGAHHLERMDIAWLPKSHKAIVVDDSGQPTIGAFDDLVPRSAVSAKLHAACVVAALNELSYLVFAAQENVSDSVNAAAPDLDYDNHSAPAYESMMAAVPEDQCIDTTIVSGESESVGAVTSDVAADSRAYWEELEIRRKSDEPPRLNRNPGTAGTNSVESNSQEYDSETQINYFHAAEGPSSSSDYENTRGVHHIEPAAVLWVLYCCGAGSFPAPPQVTSSQEHTQQNGSMETFFTALNTIVTVATSYHTAKDFGNVYITDFADFLREFRDLDITDQIDRVSALVGGIGGTASVRQASYRDQPVAIKVVRATHANEKLVKRLAREIAVWRTLSHKNVLPLYGLYYHAEERVPAMVSPWCANGNIMEYLAARSHLPAADMAQLQLRLLLDTLEGLACLHHERVVHGDLKGPNILVLDDGTACVADFGASAILCDHPQSASAAGTFRWMAPELLDDENPLRTRESDMWAFGCVIVEVISGKPPFHAIKKEPAVIIALFGGATPQRPPQASEMMWECCQECFRQKPEDRLTADILLLRLRALAEVTDEGSAVALSPQEPQREQAPAISTSYEGYSV